MDIFVYKGWGKKRGREAGEREIKGGIKLFLERKQRHQQLLMKRLTLVMTNKSFRQNNKGSKYRQKLTY